MKKISKIILTLLLCAALLIPTVLAATMPDPTAGAAGPDAKTADSREEVVYANLTAEGGVKDVCVVSILANSQAGPIVDYGGYSSVKNLTNTDELTLSGDAVTVNAPDGEFYYQGTPQSAELPWLIDVSYRLDGNELPAAELAGKSGHAEMYITTAPNGNADPSYFDNYMLQVTVTLDTAKCRDITAPDGTIANAGGDKRVTFTVMPGHSAELSVAADVTDFSMDGIEFAALSMSLDIETPDTGELTADLGSLSDAIGELNEAAGKLYSGSSDLKSGAEDLKSGSSSFKNGLTSLNGSSSELIAGSSEVMNALVTLSGALDGSTTGSLDLTALSQLPDTLDQLSAGIDNISSALTDLSSAFGSAYAALDAAIGQIPDAEIPQQDLMALYQNNPDQKDTLDMLSAYYAAAAQTKGTYAAVKEAFDAVGPALVQSAGSLDTISGTLAAISGQLNTALSTNDTVSALQQLSEGLTALSANYEDFHAGLVEYTSGVSSLAYSYSQLNSGVSDVAGGIGDLSEGLGKLYDGTSELSGETADMPAQVDDKIQEMIGEYDKAGFVPPSFVSDKNASTVSVQFVLKTEKIEKAEPATAASESVSEKETFLDRLLALFQ